VSYESENKLSKETTLSQVHELLTLLDYQKAPGKPKSIPDFVAFYAWHEKEDFRSHAGIEVGVQCDPKSGLTVFTRTSAGRSYWDLQHQNKTIKMLRDLFGGSFTTDEGRSRYLRVDEPAPTFLSSGCYLAFHRFDSGLVLTNLYLSGRNFTGPLAQDRPGPIDTLNPRLLSNNMLLPYIVAVWEEYFRASFTACLKYSSDRGAALKRARLSPDALERIASGNISIERAIAESFSFQRPSAIGDNFRLLSPKLDLAGAMRRPFRGRKVSLFDSIERLVEERNEFVHTGRLNTQYFDKPTKIAISDLRTAALRAYEAVGTHYDFVPDTRG
jgi:hypothetical protein